ncbi:MAG: ribosomal RNA small subunit methyltransferase A [Chlamydiae bacterium]|nr:ribosomal RNA small subunit methyltransferase A [Chlamydiota bacterium]
MKISTPTALKKFLESFGLKAKKYSSQNFLIDGNIIKKIVATADVNKDDIVLEIGPGPGALTEEMLELGAHVIAIEKDSELAKALHRFQTEDQRLTIFEDDILEFPLEEYFSNILKNSQKIKVVANLPYHITTPIIAKLLPLFSIIDTMTLMVQKEVGLRFTAAKGCKDYSSFTIFIEHYAQAKYSFTVEPTCFYPKPTVQSAVIHFKLHPMDPIENKEALFLLIRTAFTKRRKMLKSSLKEIYPSEKIERCLLELNLNPLSRPEELSKEDFVNLHKKLIS